MSDDVEPTPPAIKPEDSVGPDRDYVSPRIERLGTLAELTQGGGVGPDDGLGGAGDEGSLG